RLLQKEEALLMAVSTPPARQIVRRQLELHPVAGKDADAELAHLAARIRQHGVLVVELDAVIAAGELLAHRPFDFDAGFFFRHSAAFYPALGAAARTSGAAWSANCLKFSVNSFARWRAFSS